ncbi:gamma-glutamylcyclotransferase [Candidatus Kaiserbacteria bacterium]|nr:gamma-glutamylcyclotransferase [Candidatus Kaiserbacteria bacterium]
MSQIYIFAYGSLMNPNSLAKTLVGKRTTIPAILSGYRRKMSVPFGGYAYLNIIPEPGSDVRGVLIPVDEHEFSQFTAREEGYRKTDVTRSLRESIDGAAYAFIAPDSDTDLRVPRSYIETCTFGMAPKEKQEWIENTILSEIEEDLDNPVYEFHA